MPVFRTSFTDLLFQNVAALLKFSRQVN